MKKMIPLSVTGQPDYAPAFHVSSGVPAGKLVAVVGSPMSGADTVDIIVHGTGAHGASPHRGVEATVVALRNLLQVISR